MAFRLDDNVTITFLVICILASMAFVVRYKNYVPCKEFEIKTLNDKILTGVLIRFEANVAGYKNFEWDFGDNQGSSTEVNSAVHSYDRPGEYVVTLKVDDRCMETRTIFVQQAAEIVDVSQMPQAIIPEVTEVGKPTSFTDTTVNANAWEWRFGENENVDSYVKNPVYTFRQPGWKTITLTVNGKNNAVLVKKIFVNPPKEAPQVLQPRPVPSRKPVNQRPETDPLEEQLNPVQESQPAPAPVVKAPDISIADFRNMLYGVADKRVNAGSFAKYFCDGNLNTFTNINGKPSTFNELCAKLSKLKKSGDIKSMTVTPRKNQETNCISSVDIVIRIKTGIFGLSKTSDF
ncbi:PKD domain-containing protein [Niabella ginsengisoli]|uniref:PKD domain-containing protein n=1 Tax=Niabella ginsengisoli TaxID=522298 RepID=A0ABS9SLF0_9BACT|nr:PKD domain-containing protein [Niabella ginsengisoli]MCH5599213.1 PKD domain-containing protein [Niabella ginsengisoli]